MVVTGQAGMGRTTLLDCVRSDLIKTGRTAVAQFKLPEVQYLYTNPFQGFVRELRKSLQWANIDGMKPIGDVLNCLERMQKSIHSAFDLRELLRTVATLMRDRTLLVILDDADIAVDSVRSSVFQALRWFRACPQDSDDASNMELIVAGVNASSTWIGSCYEDVSSPAEFVEVELRPFSIADVRQLAQFGSDALSIAIDDGAVDEIATLSRGVPRAVQRSLALVFENAVHYAKKEITADDVKHVALRHSVDFVKAPIAESDASALDQILLRQEQLEYLLGRNTDAISRNEQTLARNTGVLKQLYHDEQETRFTSSDSEIDRLYDELAELNSQRTEHPGDEGIRAKISDRFAKLRELQEQEAKEIEMRYARTLLMPIDAGEKLLREVEEIRKNENTAKPDDASGPADDSAAQT